MKYFTREMWEGWQTDNREYWEKVHKKNFKSYFRQLEKLQPRLNPKTYDFFTKDSLHDGTLVSFNILDSIGLALAENRRVRHTKYPTQVRISAINEGMYGKKYRRYIFEILYSNISKIDLNFHTEEPLFHEPFEGIGDWGYDELTSVNKEFLRHEILFTSGSTISLEFKSVRVTKKKL